METEKAVVMNGDTTQVTSSASNGQSDDTEKEISISASDAEGSLSKGASEQKVALLSDHSQQEMSLAQQEVLHVTDSSEQEVVCTQQVGAHIKDPCQQEEQEEVTVVIEDDSEKKKVPDGGWGWFIVLGACLVHVLMGCQIGGSSGIIYIWLLERFQTSASATAAVFAINLSCGHLFGIHGTHNYTCGTGPRISGVVYIHLKETFLAASFYSALALSLCPACTLLSGGLERYAGILYIELRKTFKESATSTSWVLSLFTTVMLISGGFERSSGIFYLQLREKFHQSASVTSWVLAIFSTVRLMGGPIASALCNRFSGRAVVMTGATIATIGLLVSGFTPNLKFLYFSYGIVTGFGRSLYYAPSLIIVGQYFNKRRGLAVGLSTAGVGIGTFIFPPLVETLFVHYGFQGAFLILAGISTHCYICGALFRPLSLHRKIEENDRKRLKLKEQQEELLDDPTLQIGTEAKTKSENGAVTGKKSVLRERRKSTLSLKQKFRNWRSSISEKSASAEKKPLLQISLLKNYTFLSLCLAMVLFTLSFNSAFVFLPPLAKSRGISEIEAAYLVSIAGGCDAVSRIISGFILDLKQVKKYRLFIYNGVMFIVGMLSFIFPEMQTFGQFAAVGCLYGCLTGTYIAQKSVVIIDVLGVENLTSSFGILLWFQGLGTLIGPPVGGALRDRYGTYDGAFYFGGTGIFVGGLVLISGNFWKFYKDKQKRKEEEQKTGDEEMRQITEC